MESFKQTVNQEAQLFQKKIISDSLKTAKWTYKTSFVIPNTVRRQIEVMQLDW